MNDQFSNESSYRFAEGGMSDEVKQYVRKKRIREISRDWISLFCLRNGLEPDEIELDIRFKENKKTGVTETNVTILKLEARVIENRGSEIICLKTRFGFEKLVCVPRGEMYYRVASVLPLPVLNMEFYEAINRSVETMEFRRTPSKTGDGYPVFMELQ